MAYAELAAELCLHKPQVIVPLDTDVADNNIKQKGLGLAQARCPIANKIVNFQVVIQDGTPVRVTCMNTSCAFNQVKCN